MTRNQRKRRRRNEASRPDAVSGYRRRLFNQRHIRRTLLDLRDEDSGLVRRVTAAVIPIPTIRPFLVGTPFPSTYERMGQFADFLPSPKLESGLRWEVDILSSFSDQLTAFLKLRSEFEAA